MLPAVTIKVVGARVGVMVVQLDARTVSDCVNPVFQSVNANCCAKTLTIMRPNALSVLEKSQHNMIVTLSLMRMRVMIVVVPAVTMI